MSSSRKASALAVLFAVSSICTGTNAQTTPEKSTGKHYSLPANRDTVQWGWLDPAEKPKLVVDSGDTVSIETLRHAMDEIKPGATTDDIVKLRLANPGGGPHSVTGPIFVNGAEPGDTIEIRIKKIVIKDSENGADVAGRGLCADFNNRGLPRLPGGGHPPGRALYDSEIALREEIISNILDVRETGQPAHKLPF